MADALPDNTGGQGRRLAIYAAARMSGFPMSTHSLHRTQLKQPFIRMPDGVLPCSISHVAGIVVAAAATPGFSVGVDVEQVSRFETMTESLVGAILSPAEQALRKVWTPESLLVVWSLKEAFLKAEGTGFQDRPNKYELAHLTPDCLHDLGDGRFWLHKRFLIKQGTWITLGVLGTSHDAVAECAFGYQVIQSSEIP